MTWGTYTTLLASGMALALSIGALFVAYRSLRLSQSTSALKQSARLTEIESIIEALTLQLRNMRSRLNMAASRQRAAQNPADVDPDAAAAPNGQDPAAVRAALNDQLARRAKGI